MIKTPGHLADLDVAGSTETVLIRDVQWDHLGKEILHLDFSRVAKPRRISPKPKSPSSCVGRRPGLR